MQKTTNSFIKSDFEIVEREVPYQGVFRMVQYRLRHKLFNGAWSQVIKREVLERPPAVAILPYDPLTDQVLLIEQFRPGALAANDLPWLMEIVAGIIDTDEQPPEVALREAKEEANCNIQALMPICSYFVSPGGSTEHVDIFCGRMNSADYQPGVFGLASEHEDIRTHLLSAEAALKLVATGKIRTSPAIIALQWLALNREKIKELWPTN